MRLCPKTGRYCLSSACDLECSMQPLLSVTEDWKTPITAYKFPETPKFAYIPLDHLRSIYAGLGRAIESGDPLQIGLILGQVYKELEQYVNTTTTGDNSFTVPVNTEGSALQSGPTFGPGCSFGSQAGSVPTDTK